MNYPQLRLRALYLPFSFQGKSPESEVETSAHSMSIIVSHPLSASREIIMGISNNTYQTKTKTSLAVLKN